MNDGDSVLLVECIAASSAKEKMIVTYLFNGLSQQCFRARPLRVIDPSLSH